MPNTQALLEAYSYALAQSAHYNQQASALLSAIRKTLYPKLSAEPRKPIEPTGPTVRFPITLGKSAFNQDMITFSSMRVGAKTIIPEAPITLELPDLNRTYQTCWGAQYLLRSRFAIPELLAGTKAKKGDILLVELTKDTCKLKIKHT